MKTTLTNNLYQKITDQMINLLEANILPWRCPWSKYGQARNYRSGHIYRGINALIMNQVSKPIPYYISMNQANALGGSIKKGSEAEKVLFFKAYFKDKDGKSISQREFRTQKQVNKEVKQLSFMKYYNVFNIDDTKGIDLKFPDVQLNDNSDIEICESVLKNMDNAPELIKIDADKAFYAPSKDIINMPDISQFEKSEFYYYSLFHELVHSTGRNSRLDRKGLDTKFRKDKNNIAYEELIAEIGASFLAAHTGINLEDVNNNSAAYLDDWLGFLKSDNRIIFKAAAEAQKAVDYILGTSDNL